METKILLIFLLISNAGFAKSLDTIYSNLFDCEKEYCGYCANSIDEYKKYTELWGAWSFPIGDVLASSNLSQNKTASYKPENIYDYDLNTAWIPNDSLYGIGEYIEFEFNFPENTEYAGAYQFIGVCYLFNGYCKSFNIWEANCRVKRIKVFYNEIPLCYVILIDTWKYQTFDISKYFVNKKDNLNLNAKFEIRSGDKLRFQIVDVYKGNKYPDVAISEFLCQGGGN